MRVKSEIWIRAYLRRCQSEGVPVVIVQRGDDSAGAIFISVNRLNGTMSLYGPAPAGLPGSETDRQWVKCFATDAVGPVEVDTYLARQRKFDPDLWIIEIEDKAGRHFLGDAAVNG